MITELTPEQEAQLKVYAEKWRKIGLSTEPANRPEAERGVNLAYELAGLKPPKEIIWCQSPYEMWSRYLHLPSEVFTIGDIINSSIHHQIWKVTNTPHNIANPVYEWFTYGTIDNIVESMWNLLEQQLIIDSIEFFATYGQHDIQICCLIDFLTNVLNLNTAQLKNFLLTSHGGWWQPLPNICYISERLSRVQFDSHRVLC